MEKGIHKIIGKNPGKKLAVFAGIHGNERAGISALKRVLKKINIENGTVYFVFANPEAIKKKVRQIKKNMNRCFFENNRGMASEDKRARELMAILDKCDALLDLHASNSKKSTPFIICEKNSFEVAKKMDFGIISFGWNKIEPGAADGYMYEQGKPALCLECGSVFGLEKNIQLAEKSIYQFIEHYRCIEKKFSNSRKKKQKLIQAIKAVKKKTENFYFHKNFKDFEKLVPGELIATDGEMEYVAGKDQLIIFPDAKAVLGGEAFILGRERSWQRANKKR